MKTTVEASTQLMGIASNLWKLSFFCRIKKNNRIEFSAVMWNIISPYISDGNWTFDQNYFTERCGIDRNRAKLKSFNSIAVKLNTFVWKKYRNSRKEVFTVRKYGTCSFLQSGSQ